MSLPPEAVAAAIAAVRGRHDDENEFRKDVEGDRDVMRLDTVAALEAAAPAIAAAEREACARLADEHNAIWLEQTVSDDGTATYQIRKVADLYRGRNEP